MLPPNADATQPRIPRTPVCAGARRPTHSTQPAIPCDASQPPAHDLQQAVTASHIVPLSAEEPLAVVGGKGQSLGHLKRAGFTVPDGFVLTTPAYHDFIASNEIQHRLETLARPEIRGESLTFAPAADRIARLFANSRIPDTVASALRKASGEPGTRGVAMAVRSSATAEDLPEHSFAGQHDTFLNVSGFEAILEAVCKCWTSAWSARALSYRHERAISHTDVAVAVVVQRMVTADVSGVLFTANPVTGERAEMVVNASYGLGEGIVGGEITPDTFVIDRASGDVTSTTLGAKARMVVADGDSGTKTRDVPHASRETPALTPAQLRELAANAIEVEASFDGQPQDIEWLHADGAFVLVQSRPITGLPPPPLLDGTWASRPEPVVPRRCAIRAVEHRDCGSWHACTSPSCRAGATAPCPATGARSVPGRRSIPPTRRLNSYSPAFEPCRWPTPATGTTTAPGTRSRSPAAPNSNSRTSWTPSCRGSSPPASS